MLFVHLSLSILAFGQGEQRWHIQEGNTKVALVIANSQYAYGTDLAQPVNAGKELVQGLMDRGFDVLEAQNLSRRDLIEAIQHFAIQRFVQQANLYEESMVFYLGHGFQAEGENYLVPVDANPRDPEALKRHSVALGYLLSKLGSGRNPKLIVLDAPWVDPFEGRWRARGIELARAKGFSEIKSVANTSVLFTTSQNGAVSDDNPYLAYLIEELKLGGCMDEIVSEVERRVNQHNLQADSSALPVVSYATRLKDICFDLKPLDLDSDGDGLPDSEDRCPYEYGRAENEGCKVIQPLEGNLVPFKNKELKWGFRNASTNEYEISAIYDEVRNFREGLAQVCSKEKWGYIDKAGNEVIALKYDGVGDFREGLARVSFRRRYGYIDKAGHEVIPTKYAETYSPEEGMILVSSHGGKWGFLDISGQEAIAEKYDKASSFCEGLARVSLNGKWGYVDKAGEEAIPIKYDSTGLFEEGLAPVLINGKWGYLDKSGQLAISAKYNKVAQFRKGLALVCLNGRCGGVNKQGAETIPLKYDVLYRKQGFLLAELNGKLGYLDLEGRVVVPIEYDGLSSFSEGLIRVRRDGKYGYLDKSGNEAIPIKYGYMDLFEDGLTKVELNGKLGMVNKMGEVVIPIDYDYISHNPRDGLVMVGRKHRFGCLDEEGNQVIPLHYDEEIYFYEDLAAVTHQGFWDYIDKKGDVLIPLTYCQEAHGFNEGLAPVWCGKWGYIDRKGNVAIPFKYHWAKSFYSGLAEVWLNEHECIIINRHGRKVKNCR